MQKHGDATIIELPLVLLLFASVTVASAESPMLLRHFDVMLSLDGNERESLAICSLKCAALAKMGEPLMLERIFPLHMFPKLWARWASKQRVFESFTLVKAANQVTRNWDATHSTLAKDGCFLVNSRSAPFADMVIVPKGGDFVVFLQEKQREKAKEQSNKKRKVPELSLEAVRKEHAKCNVSTLHLFVVITDEDFQDAAKLASNEIVLSYLHHAAAIGPLLALLRKFNHSNRHKVEIK